MRTRRGTTTEAPAFWIELQAAFEGEVRVVAERKRVGPAAGSPPGTVAVGGRQPGDCGRSGVAQRKLKDSATKHLRSDFFSGMLRSWGRCGATAARRSAATR
jgi:hypothetical protein